MTNPVPQCGIAFIGGSSTLDIRIPEDLNLDYVRRAEDSLVFETPFGASPAFTLLEISGIFGPFKLLHCNMHGWRDGVTRAEASRQIFWVFRQAGVSQIIAEGGVGAVNHLLRPRDIVIPNDYIDESMRKDVKLDNRYLLVMRDPLCPQLCSLLEEKARAEWDHYVFRRGTYVCTDGRHFESRAEVQAYKLAGADIVGQSICPEVYLAREIGACYAGIYMVVNYAEGIVEDWGHEELAEIYHSRGIGLGRIILGAIRELPLPAGCQCRTLRKETLLTSVYSEGV